MRHYPPYVRSMAKRGHRPVKIKLVATVNVDSAERFLDLLSPHRRGPLWNRSLDHDAWIFRGQADSSWKLTPKAHRPINPWHDAGLGYANIDPIAPTTLEDQIGWEESTALAFAGVASDLGYEIPFDSAELRHRASAVDHHDGTHFPPIRQRGIYALAQHYGVPTRLLDWTFRPLVATYFAAIGPAKAIHKAIVTEKTKCPAPKPTGRIAVWAVNTRFLRAVCHDLDPGVEIITVPKTTNPNLQRQAGLFTLVRFSDAAKVPRKLGIPPTLDDLIASSDVYDAFVKAPDMPFLPMLYKLTMPVNEVPRLLYYLHLSGIDAARIYAGHGSIVEGMGENRYRTVCTPDDRGPTRVSRPRKR